MIEHRIVYTDGRLGGAHSREKAHRIASQLKVVPWQDHARAENQPIGVVRITRRAP